MGYPYIRVYRVFVVSLHLLTGLARVVKRKLGQGDQVSFLIVLAIPEDEKLGQADLINSSAEDYPFGWTQTVLHPKRKYALTLLVSQYISVQMNQIYMELKQRVSNEAWCPCGGHLSRDWPLGPSIPGNCLSNSRGLLIRLSYFL